MEEVADLSVVKWFDQWKRLLTSTNDFSMEKISTMTIILS